MSAFGILPSSAGSMEFVYVETLTIPAKLMPDDPAFPMPPAPKA
jgi:hypothetical protein